MSGSFTDTAPRPKLTIGRIGLYAFLVSMLLFYLVPLLIVVATSLKTGEEIRAASLFTLPSSPNFEAWRKAWSSACTGLACDGIAPGFWNSLKIVIPSVILSILFGAMNGYALAQWRFRGADLLMAAIMIGAFIPYQVILYPLVRMTAALGLYGNLPGVVVIHRALPSSSRPARYWILACSATAPFS